MKILFGLMFIPPCIAITYTAMDIISVMLKENFFLSPVFFVVTGIGLWLVIFFIMPAGTRAYIFAHEFTHALWAIFMREKVSKLKIGKNSGSVNVSNPNFLIILAPYFFPVYAFLLIALYYIISIFVDMEPYKKIWLVLGGGAWAFHLTFTLVALAKHQSDIHRCGRLFSYTVIYFFNILWICLALILISTPTLEQFCHSMSFYMAKTFLDIWNIFLILKNYAINTGSQTFYK